MTNELLQPAEAGTIRYITQKTKTTTSYSRITLISSYQHDSLPSQPIISGSEQFSPGNKKSLLSTQLTQKPPRCVTQLKGLSDIPTIPHIFPFIGAATEHSNMREMNTCQRIRPTYSKHRRASEHTLKICLFLENPFFILQLKWLKKSSFFSLFKHHLFFFSLIKSSFRLQELHNKACKFCDTTWYW